MRETELARGESIRALIEKARRQTMTPEDREEQMIDFVYGNAPEGHKRSRDTVRTYLRLERGNL